MTAPLKSSFRTIGMLGGMGPAATALTFEYIIRQTRASKDDEHIPMLIYNLPQIPDRTAAILGEGPSPVPAISHGLQILQRGMVDFVIIPCNTAFYFYPQFVASTKVPIVHIAMPIVRELQKSAEGNRKIGVLSTTGTQRSNIYSDLLAHFGFKPLLSAENRQADVMEAIRAIKAGRIDVVESILYATEDLVKSGADTVILACTELSLLYDSLVPRLPVLDSTRCLANAAIAVASKQRDISDFVLQI